MLETGRVSISSFSQQIAHLSPGDQAIYNRKTNICKINRPENLTNNSVWRKNQIVFENTSLKEVIEILSRWYDVEFVIDDPSTCHYIDIFKKADSSDIGRVGKNISGSFYGSGWKNTCLDEKIKKL